MKTFELARDRRNDRTAIKRLLANRTDSRVKSHFKFAGATDSLGINLIGQLPYVDTKAMSVRATISTSAVDRVGDLLVPSGCRTKNYRLNPVVLWGHGLEGIHLPIGKSEDPNGNLTIDIGDEVSATCYFSQKSLESRQIFELIAEGIVRATSVRETPLRQRTAFKSGEQILIVDEWDLEEWSFCAMGVNPESVAKTLSRNRLDGSPIVGPILKSLTMLAPQKKPFGVGFEESTMKNPNDLDDNGNNKDVTDPNLVPPNEAVNKSSNAVDDKDDDDTPADELHDNDGDEDDEESSDDDQDTDDETTETPSDPSKVPYGKQVIDATHNDLKNVAKSLGECTGDHLEQEDVKGILGGVRDTLKDCLKTLEGAHATHYPKMSCGLKSDDLDGQTTDMTGEDDMAESAMKSMLKSLLPQRLQVTGIQYSLKSLLRDESLPDSAKSTIKDAVHHLGRLVSQAKAMRPTKPKVKKSTEDLTPDQQRRLDEALAACRS